MYFTLLFETNHGPTLIYELCFHPSHPVGQMDNWVMHSTSQGPHFMEGDFRLLLEHARSDR